MALKQKPTVINDGGMITQIPASTSSSGVVHGGGGRRRDSSTTTPTASTGATLPLSMNPFMNYADNVVAGLQGTSGSVSSGNASSTGGTSTGTSSTGGTSTGTSSTGGTSNTGGVSQTYVDRLNELYQQQQTGLQTYQQQQAAAAQAAYNNNLSTLNNMYDKQNSLLGDNYSSTLQQLSDTYGNSRQGLEADATDALREAYIARMMGEKGLQQQLSAQGLTGGASESVRAGMMNQYGNNRNTIQQNMAKNVSDLESLYNQNRGNATQSYNTALSNAEAARAQYQMQLNSDIANQQANSYDNLYNSLATLDGSYLNNMSNILSSQSAYQAAQQQAAASQAKQAANTESDWRVGYAQDALNRGMSLTGVAQYLKNSNASDEEVANILTYLGVN